MGGHTGRRCLLTALVIAAMFTATPGWAADGPAPPPEDVVQFAQGAALTAVKAAVEGDPAAPDFSGTLHSPIPREAFLFSRAFLAGRDGDAVRSAAEWIAPVQRGDQVLGTMTIWKPHGTPEIAMIDGDVELASALTGMSADEWFIREDPTGSYYALRGDSVRPLNANARRELPRAAPVADLRAVVLARNQSLKAETRGMIAPVGSGGGPVTAAERTGLLANLWLDAGVIAVILGSLVVALRFRFRRYPSANRHAG